VEDESIRQRAAGQHRRADRVRSIDSGLAKIIHDRQDAFRSYLRDLLATRGISARRLSLQIGRDSSYLSHLVAPPQGRSRAMPTPDDLRLAAPVLGVSYGELLRRAWGVTSADTEDEEPEGGAGCDSRISSTAEALTLSDWESLSPEDREAVRDFLGYLAAKRRKRPRDQGTATKDAPTG
jgi:hypothetical protein